MSTVETITQGRSRRSTAGNRMRELLEKAHQQDEDELFAEEEGDEEFAAPEEVRDVYLDEFADTDDEVEDEEDEERAIRQEERRKAKGKGKAIFNPYVSIPKPTRPVSSIPMDASSPSSSTGPSTSLPPGMDPTTMAPTTLILEMRKIRREEKRLNRNEARRSTMRASTLRTENEILEKEQQAKLNPNRKGRKAQHEGGEIRGQRIMTQAELIAEALEEEERNKEALRMWLRREEEKRELRRVGRKRVRGPRWTWISRTVGKVVEIVDQGDDQSNKAAIDPPDPPPASDQQPKSSTTQKYDSEQQLETQSSSDLKQDIVAPTEDAKPPDSPDTSKEGASAPVADDTPAPTGAANGLTASTTTISSQSNESVAPGAPVNNTSTDGVSQPRIDDLHTNHQTVPVTSFPSAPTPQPESDTPYTRNYLILSQIPGGLPAELALVLGDHVEWDAIKYIPSRNRPINRRPPLCPFTGKVARYRHPETMIPYATMEGYKYIEAILRNRFVWSEGGFWVGPEEDVVADGMEGIAGWNGAVMGGWLGGFEIENEEEGDENEMVERGDEGTMQDQEKAEEETAPEQVSEGDISVRTSKGKKKRKSEAFQHEGDETLAKKRKKSSSAVANVVEEEEGSPVAAKTSKRKGKGKSKS